MEQYGAVQAKAIFYQAIRQCPWAKVGGCNQFMTCTDEPLVVAVCVTVVAMLFPGALC